MKKADNQQDFTAPPTLLRQTVMRAAFEDAGLSPRSRAGLVREPAWQVIRNGGKHARKSR